MTEKVSFTKGYIDSLPPPERGRKYYHDAKVRGLTVCVTEADAKTFYLYRWAQGKPQQLRLGRYPDMSIEQARRKAEEVNAAIAQGVDPGHAPRVARAEWTFSQLFDWYIEACAKPRKKTWNRDVDRYRLHLAHLGKMKLSQVSRTTVRQIHADVATGPSGIYEANRVLALVRVVFNKAIANEHFAGPNPAIGIEMYKERSRKRRLQAGELPAFFAALDTEPNPHFRDFIALLLLTGARKGNVLGMRWNEVDLASRVWTITETKNGEAQAVPLEDEEVAILTRRKQETSSVWVFPARGANGHMTSPHKAWVRLLERANIQDLRIHDLRRTLGSWMADTGANLHLIGNTLGHLHPATTAIYARLALDPVRQAKGKAIAALLGATAANEPSTGAPGQ